MAHQYGSRKQEEQKMVHMCKLYRPEQPCPKDSFLLPHIDMLVCATVGHKLLIFVDAFSGYNQILMQLND